MKDLKSKPMTEAEAAILEERLEAFDCAAVPPLPGAEEEALVLKIVGENGAILAGCTAWIDRWKCMDLSHLWVDERYRNRGMGTALLHEILREGKARGCSLATVGLFSFQASAFCENRGMTVYEPTEDCPKGYAPSYLMIRLDAYEPQDAQDGETFPIVQGDSADDEFLLEKFYAYSDSVVPRRHAYLSFDRAITDENGCPIAGVEAGVTGLDIGYLYLLWTDEPYRRHGLGTKLLREAERAIKAHGGERILASAFDWQNVAFFEKQGYEVTGSLSDSPQGHRFFSLQKRL